MLHRIFTLFLLVPLTAVLLPAQSAKDITVPVTATLDPGPFTGVTLNWSMPAMGNVLVLRRTKGQAGNQWINLLNATNTTQSSLADNSVNLGQTYEYVVQRQIGALFAYGYAQVAVEAPHTDQRGKLLLFVDSTLYVPLAPELDRLKADLAGDGWTVVEYGSGPSSTVSTIKSRIVADYNADPTNVKAVFLLGAIPIPYSGNTNWDGHTEHAGAWPADGYYADVNGTWTDVSVNNTTPARAANDNVPGDGKFDQSVLPGLVELQVGRVDFRRLDPANFGVASVVDLYKRYLDKNHAWRVKTYTVDNKALVDDNFGYFSGEAFAANGWRNAYPLVGEANVVAGDFFNNTNPQTYLMGYGCGGGTYTSAGGVGSSVNFGSDTVNIVFSMLFGSYHGDWDFETNPFMPSALASRGGILSCGWAGRPHWFMQGLASGETIGHTTRETQNAQFNNGYYGSLGESGAHIALLGDPSLRAHIIAPPGALTAAVQNCGDVVLTWTASSDDGVLGYHVYRSLSPYSGYTKLNGALVTGTSFTDDSPLNDTLYYQVRAIKRETSPGGGAYLNNSTGAHAEIIYQTPAQPNLTTFSGAFTCVNDSVWVSVSSDQPLTSAIWNGPGLNNVPGDSVLVTQPGLFTVTATAENGCTAMETAPVSLDVVPPVVNAIGGVITCNAPSIVLNGFVSPGSTFVWSGPGIQQPNVLNPVVSVPGVYNLTATNPANGCNAQATTQVTIDTTLPIVSIPSTGTLTCSSPCLALSVPNVPGLLFYVDGQPVQPGTTVNVCDPGVHTVTVESVGNGCTQDYTLILNADIDTPTSTISASTDTLSCTNPEIVLTATSTSPVVSYAWSGPGITPQNQNLQSPEINQPGTYTVIVTNLENGCSSSAAYQIVSAGDQPAVFAAGDTLTCGQPVGQLSGSSDTPGVSYLWTGPNGQTSTEANPAVDQPGTYTLVVTAPNGCTGTDAVEVIELPNDLDALMTALTQNCENDTFLVSATVSGGVSPFQYQWSTGATTETILVPAEDLLTLGLTVTDANECTAAFPSTNIAIIFNPPIAVDDVTLVDISAPGATDGSITVLASGGNAPYTYQWSNGATGNSITNLGAGFYTVTVTDAAGCTYATSFPIGISATQDPAMVLRFDVTPNPGYGPATVHLELERQALLHILVFDAVGKLVYEQDGLNAQVLNLPIHLESQAAGRYTFMVRINNTVAQRHWILVR